MQSTSSRKETGREESRRPRARKRESTLSQRQHSRKRPTSKVRTPLTPTTSRRPSTSSTGRRNSVSMQSFDQESFRAGGSTFFGREFGEREAGYWREEQTQEMELYAFPSPAAEYRFGSYPSTATTSSPRRALLCLPPSCRLDQHSDDSLAPRNPTATPIRPIPASLPQPRPPRTRPSRLPRLLTSLPPTPSSPLLLPSFQTTSARRTPLLPCPTPHLSPPPARTTSRTLASPTRSSPPGRQNTRSPLLPPSLLRPTHRSPLSWRAGTRSGGARVRTRGWSRVFRTD